MARILTIGLLLLPLGLVSCSTRASSPAPPSPANPQTPVASPTSSPTVAANTPVPTPPSGSQPSNGDLWSRLRRAEVHYFILMRHTLAPGTGDPAGFELEDCATQRNLAETGREQARRTGAVFRQQGIAVERVLSSQWCRCLETARLMELGEVEPFTPLNSFFQDRTTEPQQTAQMQAWMRRQAETPGVTVLVTHFVNIAAISGSSVTSGGMVIMTVDEQNRLNVLGEIDAL